VVVLEKMVMLVILMMVGFAIAKAGWVDAKFNGMASRLVTNVFIACTIVGSVIGVEPLLSGSELLLAIGAIFLTFLIGGAIGWAVSRCLPLEGRERSVAWLSIFFMNNVFVGFPVVEAVFGPDAIFCASLSNLPFNLLLYTVGAANLQSGERRGRIRLRQIFSVPLIATFAAILLFLTRLPVPGIIADAVTTLGSATVPMSMLIIGISLSRVPIRSALGDWRAYVVSLTRLLLCPAAAWLVMRLFLPQGGTILGVYTLTAACPCAAMITILSIYYGADDSFASKINFLSTVLSALTLPLITYLLL
jgi:hypothetical protein